MVVGQADDKTLIFKNHQGLPHRHPRDTETLCQFILGHFSARRDLPR